MYTSAELVVHHFRVLLLKNCDFCPVFDFPTVQKKKKEEKQKRNNNSPP